MCPNAPRPPPSLSTILSQTEDDDASTYLSDRTEHPPITITTGDQKTVIENLNVPLTLNLPSNKSPPPNLSYSKVHSIDIEPVEQPSTPPAVLSFSAIQSIGIEPEEEDKQVYASVGVETDEPGFGPPGRSLTGTYSLIDLDEDEDEEAQKK